MAQRTPVRSSSDALLGLLRDWQRTLQTEGVEAIVVLGPSLNEGPTARRVLATYPLDAQPAAYALALSPDFGEGPRRLGLAVVAWQPLARPVRLPETDIDAAWRQAWRERGMQAVVRVGFALPAGRSFECFLFVTDEPQQRSRVAMLAWLVQSFWPTLREALAAAWCPLTPRELECVRLAFDGLTARASAERMACTERTVNFHLANAMAKLDVDNKMAAIQRACWLGAV